MPPTGAGRGVVAVAGRRVHAQAVDLVAADHQRVGGRVGRDVLLLVRAARRADAEVVAARALVVERPEDAGRAGAELVLGARVCVATGGLDFDVERGVVARAAYLVERAWQQRTSVGAGV